MEGNGAVGGVGARPVASKLALVKRAASSLPARIALAGLVGAAAMALFVYVGPKVSHTRLFSKKLKIVAIPLGGVAGVIGAGLGIATRKIWDSFRARRGQAAPAGSGRSAPGSRV